MVTVVKKPQGYKIIDQVVAATIEDSSGDALVRFPYHSLTTGDVVYLTSDIDDYFGFWFVTVITPDTFKIAEYGSEFVPYFQDAEVDYYQTQPHEWSSVFLPIVYKISNTRWPTNTQNTARTITGFSDDNGYTAITVSGILLLGLKPLNYLQITGAGEADGVWQVVETDGGITIDLPYDASNSLVGASIQVYWNNYQVKVKVFAGLPPGHRWEAQKPYEEVGELSLTPDENNIAMFSVADYVKSKVAIKNNLTLFALPNNLDAFAAFYISVTETFDDSDSYTIITNDLQPYVDDDFTGYAIAGKLPFKNVYSGFYSEFVYTSGSPARWLTDHATLLAVIGRYFDISFILNVSSGETPGFTPDHPDALSMWGISNTSSEPMVWTGGIANPFCTISAGVSGGGLSDYFRDSLTFEAGRTYKYSYTMDLAATFSVPGNVQFRIHLACCDVSFNILDEFTDDQTILSTFPTGASSGTFEFVCPVGAVYIGFFIEIINGTTNSALATITSFLDETVTIPPSTGGTLLVFIDGDQAFTIENPGIGVIRVPFEFAAGRHCVKVAMQETIDDPQYDLTEEICVDVVDDCEITDGFTPENIRLLEDGDFRLLE